ncbi:hypothetical protein DVA67_000790 [Solirubrobacter sp. CPCC 204708]|uniref:MSCRAMM family adhesin SdrC n=1 Tax=Solirubrobacter deserti TaxID=2282478 RepID=A0ABT4RV12_9ACTN|nr:hypothetical protein [Solirubrobacter deserti]MBE2314494.1 hypothetical protein [Solirubrobacter deserti]MDA0142101.1 MSCRAMM family adhesin SdrC [Solirubrobacter deserti]
MARIALLTSLVFLLLAPAAQAGAKRLPAKWAKANNVSVKAAAKDKDRDGLTNWGEFRAGTNPRKRDSDRDKLPDALEDRDRDKLVNADEVAAGTDPRKRDSDRDKRSDAREDRDRDGLANGDERVTGHDLRARDTNGDGELDGADNAGWVTASANGTVTIRLAVGGTLTAQLTGDSWVDCTATAITPTAGTSTSAPVEDEEPTEEDPVDEELVDLPEVEDDPAALPAELASVDDEQEVEDVDADIADVDPVDLGECATVLKVGAVVHRAAVEDGVLTDLELVKR